MKQRKFESYDGTILHSYLYECKNPKYVVQIAHGMQEYCATYFEFAQYLADNNCIVFMFDERGHGKTAKNVKQLGKVDGDIFAKTVNDHLFVSETLVKKYNLPLIFFGHSYGSFIGQKYLQCNPPATKVILSGSSYMNTFEVKMGRIISSIQKAFCGVDKPAKLIESMSLKKYPKYFETASWITSDQKKTDEFYADEFNGTSFPIGFYYYMFKNQLKLYNKKTLKTVDKKIKVLLVSGYLDPVGKFSKGASALYRCYQKMGISVKLKLFPNMRHGVVQEKNRIQVFKYLLSFIQNT